MHTDANHESYVLFRVFVLSCFRDSHFLGHRRVWIYNVPMSDILQKIVAAKRIEIERRRVETPLCELEAQLPMRRRCTISGRHRARAGGWRDRGGEEGVAVRRRLAGRFRSGGDRPHLRGQWRGRISVLTDEPFFQGHLSYLSAIRHAVSPPLLRKDFILDRYQFVEARLAGADAVLLIAEILGERDLRRCSNRFKGWACKALVELYDRENLPRVLAAGVKLIGVNNRDLRSFVTSLERTRSNWPATSRTIAAWSPRAASAPGPTWIAPNRRRRRC